MQGGIATLKCPIEHQACQRCELRSHIFALLQSALASLPRSWTPCIACSPACGVTLPPTWTAQFSTSRTAQTISVCSSRPSRFARASHERGFTSLTIKAVRSSSNTSCTSTHLDASLEPMIPKCLRCENILCLGFFW